ncbi:MAG: DUF4276 family protein [Anaerolineae bacterium]|nr:DUF4276 family protein [Anaerolineae bacterium]
MLLHFYVEEASAEAALVELVPRILQDYTDKFEYEIYPFPGKLALLRNLPNRLKTYRHFSDQDWRVIVLIDRDDEDCEELKRRIERIALEAGLATRSSTPQHFQVINRIAIEELEAWFFGDIEAVVAAYPRVDPDIARQAAYRDPDAIRGGTWEQLERILKFYHPGGLEKIRAATDISHHMEPERNRSNSFQVFRNALLDLFD